MAAQNSVGVNTSTVPSVPTIPPPQQPDTPPLEQDQQDLQREIIIITEEEPITLATGSAVSSIEEEQGDFIFGEDEEYFEEPFTNDVIELPDPDPNAADEIAQDASDKGTDEIPVFTPNSNFSEFQSKAIYKATLTTYGIGPNSPVTVKGKEISNWRGSFCGWYTFNHAYNYSRIVLGLANQTTKKGNKNIVTQTNINGKKGIDYRSLGEQRGPIYAAGVPAAKFMEGVLIDKCGYKSSGEKSGTWDIINKLTKDANYWGIGDVIIYWGGSYFPPINKKEDRRSSSNIYGHIQIYTNGKSYFPEGYTEYTWATDYPHNYGAAFVYTKDFHKGKGKGAIRFDQWKYVILRAPQPSK